MLLNLDRIRYSGIFLPQLIPLVALLTTPVQSAPLVLDDFTSQYETSGYPRTARFNYSSFAQVPLMITDNRTFSGITLERKHDLGAVINFPYPDPIPPNVRATIRPTPNGLSVDSSPGTELFWRIEWSGGIDGGTLDLDLSRFSEVEITYTSSIDYPASFGLGNFTLDNQGRFVSRDGVGQVGFNMLSGTHTQIVSLDSLGDSGEIFNANRFGPTDLSSVDDIYFQIGIVNNGRMPDGADVTLHQIAFVPEPHAFALAVSSLCYSMFRRRRL